MYVDIRLKFIMLNSLSKIKHLVNHYTLKAHSTGVISPTSWIAYLYTPMKNIVYNNIIIIFGYEDFLYGTDLNYWNQGHIAPDDHLQALYICCEKYMIFTVKCTILGRKGNICSSRCVWHMRHSLYVEHVSWTVSIIKGYESPLYVFITKPIYQVWYDVSYSYMISFFGK